MSLDVGSAAQAAASIFNTRQQIKAAERAMASQQDFERAQAGVRFNRELQLEAVRHMRLADLAELDSRLRQDNDLAALQARKLFDTYPVEEGPGHLRQSLRLLSADLSTLPLVVLLPTFHGSPDGTWEGLRGAVVDALRRRLATDGLIELQDSLRTFSWPHAAFYWNDLYGIPTLIVQVRYFRDVLDVSLGGCHLRPKTESPAEALHSVYRHRIARPERWTPESIEDLNAKAPKSHLLAVPKDEAGQLGLDVEIAARAVTAVVTAAVDAYYLGNSVRYPQHFDEAAAMLGPTALTEWPADLGVPLSRVADPAFHLLKVATRQASRGQASQAIVSLRHSLAILSHPDYAVTGPPFPPVAEAAEHLPATGPLYAQALRNAINATADALSDHDPLRRELDDMSGALHD
ncbi:hypothetical protein [Streptomyces flavidovirens]|uniref:hypothetical protein n=1 Tax=Streptomyces flavidovirens TaxID=67298 RepID=UPI00041D1F4A|nr:hypothetical protein [Streptomyces flavidovirens]